MRVTDIDIADLKRDDGRGCFRASVSMTMRPDGSGPARQVNFICQSFRAADCPSSLITYDLVTHALDQARLLPGYEHGSEAISVDITNAVERLPLGLKAAG